MVSKEDVNKIQRPSGSHLLASIFVALEGSDPLVRQKLSPRKPQHCLGQKKSGLIFVGDSRNERLHRRFSLGRPEKQQHGAAPNTSFVRCRPRSSLTRLRVPVWPLRLPPSQEAVAGAQAHGRHGLPSRVTPTLLTNIERNINNGYWQ